MTTKVYVIGDAHISTKIPQTRFEWIGRDVKQESPDVLIQIGDFASLDSLSSYEPNDSYSGKFKPLFATDLKAVRRALQNLDTASQYRGPRIITEGNHENRIDRFSERTPEIFGMLRESYDSLTREFGWRSYPYGHIHYIDKVGFTHVPFNITGRPYGGKTAHYRVAHDYDSDIVYGHDHRAGVVRYPRPGGRHTMAVNVGCALPWGHVEPYAKHSTTGWWWGTVVLEIRKGKIVSWNFKDMRGLHG